LTTSASGFTAAPRAARTGSCPNHRRGRWIRSCNSLATSRAVNPGRCDVKKSNGDEWTIERWRTEPRLVGLDFADAPEEAPPLWKDLTLASVVALLLWAAAAILFG
jgi:hypothetical protein